MDEFLQLFKGQISLDDFRFNMTYKEALLLKTVREERLQREYEQTKGSLDLEAIADEM